MDIDTPVDDIESKVIKYMNRAEITTKIRQMLNNNERRLTINIDNLRDIYPDLADILLKRATAIVPFFKKHLLELTNELMDQSSHKLNNQGEKSLLAKKQIPFDITFEGNFGKNMVSPRGLTAELTNQLVLTQGIVTRMSIVRPKLVHSVHYCEDTKQGTVKEYADQYAINNETTNIGGNFSGNSKANQFTSNTVPVKDINGNPLSFEYGLSFFRDFQTLLVQEPPERTPVGQLPRSVEVVLQDDLIDKVKPGDR